MRSFPWKWRLADLPAPTRGTVFSTFACGGGSSMGYKRAGYRVLGCVEIDPKINEIYRANLHPEYNFLMDLRQFNEIPDAELPPELFKLDILDGSPPCSTFSTAGKREKGWGVEKVFREGQAKQTLDDLFFVFLRTVEKLRPRVVVAENVTGLVKGNARGYVNQIVARFRELGYAVQLFQLNAAFMEVPQKRERVFFVARNLALLPPPNPPPLKLDFHFAPIPFGDVKSGEGAPLAMNVDVDSMFRLLYKARPGDKDLGDISMRERGKVSCFGRRLVRDADVCPTVVSADFHIRFPERTGFGTGDYRHVGTFPQDYDFGASAASMAHYLVGMSVPPSMTAHIADEIWEQWLS